MAAERRDDERVQGQGATMKRRGILAAAGAVVAGIVAKQTSEPVGAITGSSGSIGFYAAPGTFPVGNLPAGTIGIAGSDSPDFANTGAAVTAGVMGIAHTTSGYYVNAGVFGRSTSTGNGVSGNSLGGYGVIGTSFGVSTAGVGVVGSSDAGTGVQGICTTGSGVVGGSGSATPGTAGGYFYTTANNGSGVVGQCFNPGGGAAAFVGAAVAPNYAAFFTGTVVVSGKLVVSDPSYKSGALRHPDGSTRLVYCVESPESWIEDVGTGTLTGGKATVTFEKDFTAVTHTDDYHVFLTPYGSIGALRVALRKGDGFAVEEIGGTSSGTFSWKVMVKAKSEVKAERLAKFAMPTIETADKPPVLPAPATSKQP